MASPNSIAYSVFKQRHHVAVDETSTCAKRTTKTVTMILPLFLIQFQETCRRKTDFFWFGHCRIDPLPRLTA